MASIFKAYDIRGAYPGEVNEAIAFKIGAAFVEAAGGALYRDRLRHAPLFPHPRRRLCPRRDGRGRQVTNIGMVTTPLLYFAIIDGSYDGGAMVTASHLPGESNGFKLCREKAIPLSGDAGLPAIERMVADMGSGVPRRTGRRMRPAVGAPRVPGQAQNLRP